MIVIKLLGLYFVRKNVLEMASFFCVNCIELLLCQTDGSAMSVATYFTPTPLSRHGCSSVVWCYVLQLRATLFNFILIFCSVRLSNVSLPL